MNERRIRKLKVKARDENHIRQGVALLEDGFRSASLPGLPPNCLVVVRHVDLGTVSTSNAPATIALRIDERLRTLSTGAVSADEGEVQNANIVWFRDSLQPYVTLVKMIARGQVPTAWYWVSAAPNWQQSEWQQEGNQRMALVALLQGAAQSPAGAVGTARLVQVLHEIGKLDNVLSVLAPPDALTILRHSALYPRLVSDDVQRHGQPVTVVRTLPLRWKQTLAKWVRAWGENDVRATWLVYTGLVNQNPALSETTSTVELIRAIIHNLVHAPNSTRAVARSRGAGSQTQLAGQNKFNEDSKDIAGPDLSTADTKALAGEKIQFDIEQDEIETGRGPNEQTSIMGSERPETDGAGFAAHHNPTAERARPNSNDGPEPPDVPQQAIDWTLESEDTHREIFSHRGPRNRIRHDDSIVGLQPSDSAGLVFAVSVLELLGIREVLDRHPLLAECNLPARILWKIADRLKVDVDGPACAFIPEVPNLPDGLGVDFVAPQRWRHLVTWPSKPKQVFGLRPIAGRRDAHVLTDISGRQALAVWAGEMPSTVQRWIEKSDVEPLKPFRKYPDIEFVEGAFLMMIGRFLRLHAGIGLRSLIARPGEIATTPTWVDVVFDQMQADIRVRKAGIDIDPGWVPWLGKVIQFHYLQNEKAKHDE